ncbi:MAG TPA: FAD binding domain-containing protein [Phycisphaerales bacterium]|nr:FAD binding domain-containing protein [Phycisphaerales bacterium]HMP38600.1 FAD binding domain-containing protein [Phycisphaerales bacterium]
MNRFSVIQARSIDEAAAALAPARQGARRVALPQLKAGGMDLIDLMKEGIAEPPTLINLLTVEEAALRRIDEGRFGALVTLAELAADAALLRTAPVIARSVALAATPQVRNVATAAGSLLQRPRCWYYRNHQFDCLKKGGSTCFAVEGENRHHAIFGGGPCHIVHPSNLAPALVVCDGSVDLVGGDRTTLPIARLFHGPDRGSVLGEHTLEPGEIIVGIRYRPAPTSGFCAIKEKQSFDWPLVFACVALALEGTTIAGARVCAGAVAPTPWPLPAVEEALRGVDLGDGAALSRACAVAAEGATPMRDNAFKVRLLPVAVRRAIEDAVRPARAEEATP